MFFSCKAFAVHVDGTVNTVGLVYYEKAGSREHTFPVIKVPWGAPLITGK